MSVGLDICPVAIAAAQAELDTELAGHPHAAAVASACQFLVEDFFSYRHHSGQQFDVGYDYTFLVRELIQHLLLVDASHHSFFQHVKAFSLPRTKNG